MSDDRLRALHLFAGAGGSVIAFRALGIESVGAVEIDPFCCEVLKHHGEKVLGTDVRSFDATGLVGDVDIVTGGWPCQGNSVAGKRRGLKDDRSNLWWELLRILKESRAPYLFAENVRGAISVNAGRDFRTVLRSLDDAGYDARWVVTSAAASGAPHKRERLWLFAWRREVGDPARKRLQGFNGSAIGDEQGQHREGRDVLVSSASDNHEAGGAGDPPKSPSDQRSVGGTSHGLAFGVGDWPAARGLWPSRRGQTQYPWEAPRVVDERVKGDLQALKALGNGWVPMQAINAWLELTSTLGPGE